MRKAQAHEAACSGASRLPGRAPDAPRADGRAFRSQRRALLAAFGCAALASQGAVAGLAALAPSAASAAGERPTVEVWKSPTCGCCKEWIEHLRAAGFDVVAHDTGNVAMRAKLGMPASLGSCHTARVGGYVIEGHVPARDIRRLLAERPRALGLSVPNMPIGSPGMEMGDRRDPYDVLLVARDGGTRVWQSYR